MNEQAMAQEIVSVWSEQRATRILNKIDSEADARWFARIVVIVERFIEERS